MKINLEKVLACQDTTCPKCGSRIPPAEVQRIDFTRVRCPACCEAFVPNNGGSGKEPRSSGTAGTAEVG
jgi:hypothetical protein